MISLHVSAVLLVRDGYSGQIVEGGGVSCTLNGVPVRPAVKPGGYLVLVNLPEGTHRLRLRAARFQEETVEITVEQGATASLYPVLKPGAGYFFRHSPTRAALRLESAGEAVWLAPPGTPECKLAQAKAEAGAVELRLFCKGGLDRLPIPGPFLLEDGKKSELCVIESVQGETALLAEPLGKEHARGRRLLPAGRYRADQGVITAALPQPGELFVLCSGREGAKSVSLTEGDNEASLSWK